MASATTRSCPAPPGPRAISTPHRTPTTQRAFMATPRGMLVKLPFFRVIRADLAATPVSAQDGYAERHAIVGRAERIRQRDGHRLLDPVNSGPPGRAHRRC